MVESNGLLERFKALNGQARICLMLKLITRQTMERIGCRLLPPFRLAMEVMLGQSQILPLQIAKLESPILQTVLMPILVTTFSQSFFRRSRFLNQMAESNGLLEQRKILHGRVQTLLMLNLSLLPTTEQTGIQF